MNAEIRCRLTEPSDCAGFEAEAVYGQAISRLTSSLERSLHGPRAFSMLIFLPSSRQVSGSRAVPESTSLGLVGLGGVLMLRRDAQVVGCESGYSSKNAAQRP